MVIQLCSKDGEHRSIGIRVYKYGLWALFTAREFWALFITRYYYLALLFLFNYLKARLVYRPKKKSKTSISPSFGSRFLGWILEAFTRQA